MTKVVIQTMSFALLMCNLPLIAKVTQTTLTISTEELMISLSTIWFSLTMKSKNFTTYKVLQSDKKRVSYDWQDTLCYFSKV